RRRRTLCRSVPAPTRLAFLVLGQWLASGRSKVLSGPLSSNSARGGLVRLRGAPGARSDWTPKEATATPSARHRVPGDAARAPRRAAAQPGEWLARFGRGRSPARARLRARSFDNPAGDSRELLPCSRPQIRTVHEPAAARCASQGDAGDETAGGAPAMRLTTAAGRTRSPAGPPLIRRDTLERSRIRLPQCT